MPPSKLRPQEGALVDAASAQVQASGIVERISQVRLVVHCSQPSQRVRHCFRRRTVAGSKQSKRLQRLNEGRFILSEPGGHCLEFDAARSRLCIQASFLLKHGKPGQTFVLAPTILIVAGDRERLGKRRDCLCFAIPALQKAAGPMQLAQSRNRIDDRLGLADQLSRAANLGLQFEQAAGSIGQLTRPR